jgi:hypothetical protein
MFSSGARRRLPAGIGRQYTERDRHAGFERNLLKTARGFAGDKVKVRCFAANYSAQRHNSMILTGFRQPFRRDGELECAGHEKLVESRLAGAESFARAIQKFLRDLAVEARHDYREPKSAGFGCMKASTRIPIRSLLGHRGIMRFLQKMIAHRARSAPLCAGGK